MSPDTPRAGGNRPPTKPLSAALTIAPVGSYHPDGICAWCSALSSEAALHVVVLIATRAEAVVCVDRIACMRRARGAE
jgi:hypothetical protein